MNTNVNAIDTHTHFYDPNREEGVPWPSPEDAELYRTVLPDEFVTLSAPLGVGGTVVVEASSRLEDNRWILDLAAENPAIVGFMGNLDIDDPRFIAHLDRFSPHPLYCGIRLGTRAVSGSDAEHVVGCLKELSRRDLALDLIVGAKDLIHAAALASQVPDLRIILDHVGGAAIDGGKPDPEWVEGMSRLSDCANLTCKVSALAEGANERPAPGNLAFYRPTLDVLWRLYGSERLIYGSNWPVSAKAAPYETVFRIAYTYFEPKGTEVINRVFRQNALGFYRCAEPPAGAR